MKIERRMFSSLNGRRVFPEACQCKACGYFDADHPAFQERVQEEGYDEYTVKIATCTCAKEAATAGQARIMNAHLPSRRISRTFSNWIARTGTEVVLDHAKAFCKEDGTTPPIMVIVGGTGTGKTHLLEAICRKYLERGRAVRYEFVPDLLREMRDTQRAGSMESLNNLVYGLDRHPLLVLDDIGSEKASDFTVEQLTALVDLRYRSGRRLAVATNLTRSDVAERLSERIASRLWDKTEGVAQVVHMSADTNDFRATRT